MSYGKITLDLSELKQGLLSLLSSSPQLVSALVSDRVSASFSESLMLAVTSVYECRYCTWIHAELAEYFGVEEEKISALLEGDISMMDEYERPALAFAIHYAQTEGLPTTSALKKLSGKYESTVVDDLLKLLEFVSFTNRLGNTFDSFIAHRLEDKPPENSLLITSGVFVVMLPLYLSLSVITKRGKNPFLSLDT